jgi:hypothetical protein
MIPWTMYLKRKKGRILLLIWHVDSAFEGRSRTINTIWHLAEDGANDTKGSNAAERSDFDARLVSGFPTTKHDIGRPGAKVWSHPHCALLGTEAVSSGTFLRIPQEANYGSHRMK